MKEILNEFIENHKETTVKLLNIACGPCKEIRELLSENFWDDKRIIFTGLDNDEGSLEFSRASLNGLPSNVQVRFMKENVLDLFKNEENYRIVGKQDIIYILGLSEYLPDRIFKKLVNFLFNLLNRNGKLVITYKDKNIPFPAVPPDWLCDWDFVKRDEQDLLALAKGLGPEKYSLQIERERTGCIFFTIITKSN